MEKLELSKLKYPNMRDELIFYLDMLKKSDLDMDDNDLDYVIHFIFDDTALGVDAKKEIGYFLCSNPEADLMNSLAKELDRVLDFYGTELHAHEYVQLPEWKNVASFADRAFKLINGGHENL